MRRILYEKQPGKEIVYVSVVFDKQISDPANITIKDDESVLDSILSQFRRCLCKKTTEGEVAICWLDDKNSNFYEDGTPAILTGEEGDVMVYFPEFWYKWEKIDDNKFKYMFSLSNAGKDWKHVTRSLLSAYKAYLDYDKIYSRSDVTPTTGESVGQFTKCANNRGYGYQIIDFQQHCTIAFMLYSKYKTRDLQYILGAGGATIDTQTGSSNITGIADSKNESSKYVCGLGLEGVFGGAFEYVGGVSVSKNAFTITDPDGSTHIVHANTFYTGSGWVKNIAAEDGPFFDVIPTITTGGNGGFYADYFWHSSGSNLYFARSCEQSYDRGGVSSVYAATYSYVASPNTGSRLSFRGIIHEISSTSEFKSLPLL